MRGWMRGIGRATAGGGEVDPGGQLTGAMAGLGMDEVEGGLLEEMESWSSSGSTRMGVGGCWKGAGGLVGEEGRG